MPIWFSIVYISLILASVVLFIISLATAAETSINILIVAYSTLATGILMITSFLINHVSSSPQNTSLFQFLWLFLMNAGGFLILLATIGFSLYLVVHYKSIISSGHVASSYNTFTNLSVSLVLLQVYLFYSGMQQKSFLVNGTLSQTTNSLIYLIGVINIICVIIINTILKYYSTDGFKSQNSFINL